MKRDELVETYFHLGFGQREILQFMSQIHDDNFSLRTLKRTLNRLGLFRRKSFSDVVAVALFIVKQYEGNGQLHGYKWLHQKCVQNGFVVTQQIVRNLLLILFPNEVAVRRKRRLQRRKYESAGPNAVWHMDGHDKLKPFGISIHGCIDGFSRNII